MTRLHRPRSRPLSEDVKFLCSHRGLLDHRADVEVRFHGVRGEVAAAASPNAKRPRCAMTYCKSTWPSCHGARDEHTLKTFLESEPSRPADTAYSHCVSPTGWTWHCHSASEAMVDAGHGCLAATTPTAPHAARTPYSTRSQMGRAGRAFLSTITAQPVSERRHRETLVLLAATAD